MKLYLIIEWLNDSPIINGANYYQTKSEAITAALHLEQIQKKIPSQLAINVKYTICEIYKGKVPTTP